MSGKPLPLEGQEWNDIRNEKINLNGLEGYTKELIELIIKMMSKDPSVRPSAEQILDEYFLSPKEIELRSLKRENKELKEELEKLKIRLLH